MSPVNYLSDQDYQNYGGELLDVSQRAALQALSPELQEIRQQNLELQRRLAVEARHRLDQQVAAAVPDYQTIDRDPRWLQWLRAPDQLSGVPRQRLLDAAIASGSAARVRAFFDGFRREVGNQSPAPAPAATTSGRARSSSSGKPVYTRAQVKELYARHQRGAFAGQEAEWNRLEYDIIRASGEGRILGGVDVAGK